MTILNIDEINQTLSHIKLALIHADELVKKLDQCHAPTVDIFHFAHIKGMNYTGPTFNEELKTLRASLAKLGL